MERITEGGQWAEMRQIAGDDKGKIWMDGSERDETFYKIAKDLECQFLSCHNPISPASDRVGRRRSFPERIWRCVRKGPKLGGGSCTANHALDEIRELWISVCSQPSGVCSGRSLTTWCFRS